MANGSIQLPPDSTGKKLQTFENAVGAEPSVHAEGMVICDSSGVPVAVATETTLVLIKAKTDNVNVALSTRALEAGGNLAAIAGKDFATEATLALVKAKTDNITKCDTDNVKETLPSTLLAGEKTVAAAGSPEALATSTAVVSGVVVQAKPANTGNILVGNSASQKILLTAGESLLMAIDNLNKIYVDVTVNGEGVNYIGG